MNLIKTTLGSAVGTSIKILTGLIANKILAVYVGPGGIALLGQLGNFVGMIVMFGSGGTNAGVTKYIAEYDNEPERQNLVIKTALAIATYSSIVLGIFIWLFAPNISLFLFSSHLYVFVFRFFAISLVFISLNSILLSVLNGYKQIKLLITLGVIGNIVSFIITSILAIMYSIEGALVSSILAQAVGLVVTIVFIRHLNWVDLSVIKSFASIHRATLMKLSSYSCMALTTAFVVPLSQILVRTYIVKQLSLEQAGYWQGVSQISTVYLMIITVSLSTYFLPRLSEIKDSAELIAEIRRGYKLLLPITIFMALSIFVLREFIITVLLSPDFLPMKSLFLFQLIGDVLKISSWLLALLMIAKTMTRLFIISEIAFSLLNVGLSIFFINVWGLIGVTYAYALHYLLYLGFIVFFMGKYLNAKNRRVLDDEIK